MPPHKKHDTSVQLHQKLLLISLDGLRWDFISKHKHLLPNIISLQQQGVGVSHVKNVFPTNTFPNHYTTVTGLYPESHGIIDNQMLDQTTWEKFNIKTTDSKWWNEAEPIWVTNQKQGHKSGVSNWPGYNVKIRGISPTFTDAGNSEGVNADNIVPSTDKVDIALHWLQQPGLTFVALYIEEPDTLKHETGERTSISKIEETCRQLDGVFGHLKNRIAALSLQDQVNVIVIGDHGYTEISNRRIIRLSDYLDWSKHVRDTVGMTFVSVYPKPGHLTTVYNKLRHAHAHMTVYLKADLPERMHIKHSKRTAPLILLADRGWLIETGQVGHIVFDLDYFRRGDHGYSNLIKDMHPGFFAFGPCFKQGQTFDSLQMVDVYSMMCAILNIKPRPNNGTLDRVKMMLDNSCLATGRKM
eukprot:gene18640-20521_t